MVHCKVNKVRYASEIDTSTHRHVYTLEIGGARDVSAINCHFVFTYASICMYVCIYVYLCMYVYIILTYVLERMWHKYIHTYTYTPTHTRNTQCVYTNKLHRPLFRSTKSNVECQGDSLDEESIVQCQMFLESIVSFCWCRIQVLCFPRQNPILALHVPKRAPGTPGFSCFCKGRSDSGGNRTRDTLHFVYIWIVVRVAYWYTHTDSLMLAMQAINHSSLFVYLLIHACVYI